LLDPSRLSVCHGKYGGLTKARTQYTVHKHTKTKLEKRKL